jgi:hypothetical protein
MPKANDATTGHTPGPWRVYHENGSMGSGGHWGVETEKGTPLAGTTVARVCAVGPVGRANAALIAAAPDLLAENARLRERERVILAALRKAAMDADGLAVLLAQDEDAPLGTCLAQAEGIAGDARAAISPDGKVRP